MLFRPLRTLKILAALAADDQIAEKGRLGAGSTARGRPDQPAVK
jgi:hypothetical protein